MSQKRYENFISFSLIALFVGALIVQRMFFVGAQDGVVEITATPQSVSTVAEAVVVTDENVAENPFAAIEPAAGGFVSDVADTAETAVKDAVKAVADQAAAVERSMEAEQAQGSHAVGGGIVVPAGMVLPNAAETK